MVGATSSKGFLVCFNISWIKNHVPGRHMSNCQIGGFTHFDKLLDTLFEGFKAHTEPGVDDRAAR